MDSGHLGDDEAYAFSKAFRGLGEDDQASCYRRLCRLQQGGKWEQLGALVRRELAGSG